MLSTMRRRKFWSIWVRKESSGNWISFTLSLVDDIKLTWRRWHFPLNVFLLWFFPIFPYTLSSSHLSRPSTVLNWYNELRCCCFHILRYRLEATRDGARKCSIVNKRKNSERKVRKFSISSRKKRCRLLISIKRREIPKNANIAK